MYRAGGLRAKEFGTVSSLRGSPPETPSRAACTRYSERTVSPTCLLLVGDRVILRASGPPEAEYAMFEIGEIELRASDPHRVREHGYQTTVEQARTRLVNMGITTTLARDVADALQPTLSDAYARGSAVRRVARYLGPLELFQSDAYDGQAYRGVFLDLATLARDIALDHCAATLQALYLATALEGEPGTTRIFLSTDACTKDAKPGARTHKRPSFTDPQRLLNALGGLSHKAPTPAIGEPLPRADVIAFLRARADAAPDEDARALYRALEEKVSLRDMPERGPLAHADLWSIETRIESGELGDVLDAIEIAEKRHGRTPGTAYLRARASLLMKLEAPKAVAERISSLALSMPQFRELEVLAAEAWLEAGEARRALPFARDLVDAQNIDEGLVLRAQRLVARAVGAAPNRAPEPPPDRPSQPTTELFTLPRATRTLEAPPAVVDPQDEPTLPRASALPPPPRESRPPEPRLGGVRIETRPPPSMDPRAEPDPTPPPRRSSVAPPMPESPYMGGATLPSYRPEEPAPILTKAPLFPKIGSDDELAEHLSLPPGVEADGRALDGLPTSVLEARIQFTLLARELGLDYRLKRGIDLRADVNGIEAMQAVLYESFPERVVRTSEDAHELRKHGALLSEILARRLEAEWLDISSPELGHWVMIVPPDTRVWPFGRVARLVAMGHRERDLVSYYFELSSRARGR
jgi:hypothetical protein